jgi:subtilisin family serine protease
MKKLLLFLFAILLFSVTSCNKEQSITESTFQNTEQDPTTPLSASEIQNKIDESFQNTGSFNWQDSSNLLLWSATLDGDNILSVGYGNESFNENRSANLNKLKEQIKNMIAQNENERIEKILIYENEVLNYFDIQVTQYSTIAKLRTLDNIRYIEPTGYMLPNNTQRSDSGCSTSSESLSSADYGTLSSGAKIPWSYYDHNINKAWSYSKGRGIGVGVIDTGVSDYQPNMGYKFDDYYGNRYIQKYGTYVDSWKWWATNTDGYHDKCGHGTSSCSSVAAPDNNSGLPVGVAYECNLISYRGTGDVFLNGYHERKGVTKALEKLAVRSDVKIISMSIGYPWSIGNIRDAVEYAYSKNKMILAAGGTSTSYTNWYPVIFPASMNETIAVTGVEENTQYNECDVCHYGSQIDFTYVMERSNNHHQPVTGYYNNSSRYFGGSSVATASTAGIAALIWAKYPSWSREQVLARMKWAAALYPNKSSDFGYGNIDALKAVRGY